MQEFRDLLDHLQLKRHEQFEDNVHDLFKNYEHNQKMNLFEFCDDIRYFSYANYDSINQYLME